MRMIRFKTVIIRDVAKNYMAYKTHLGNRYITTKKDKEYFCLNIVKNDLPVVK